MNEGSMKLEIKPDLFFQSAYKHETEKSKDDDSYGLVYNDFFHQMGDTLEVDIIWSSISDDDCEWLIANNDHMKVYLKDQGANSKKILECIPKTDKGNDLIEHMKFKYLHEFDDFVSSI